MKINYDYLLVRRRGKWIDKQSYRKENFSAFISAICLFCILIIILMSSFVHAQCITDEQAVKCLLGEARSEGYESLLAHAEALRNRGHLQGVYGCSSDLSKEMSYLKRTGIYDQAVRAWEESKTSNVVNGASYWGSLKVDGKWIATMKRNGFICTAIIKNTAFYREVKKHDKS